MIPGPISLEAAVDRDGCDASHWVDCADRVSSGSPRRKGRYAPMPRSLGPSNCRFADQRPRQPDPESLLTGMRIVITIMPQVVFHSARVPVSRSHQAPARHHHAHLHQVLSTRNDPRHRVVTAVLPAAQTLDGPGSSRQTICRNPHWRRQWRVWSQRRVHTTLIKPACQPAVPFGTASRPNANHHPWSDRHV